MGKDYDVIIMGGGLAGLTLAMQVKQRNAAINIAVLEKRGNAAPDAAHKVGESTVELGTYYLRETLNLKNYLEENHLHKHGLRFFFPIQDCLDLEKRVEYGARNELHVPSHQIDRGMFENDMIGMVQNLGVDVLMDCTVKEIELDDERHTVHFTQGNEKKSLTALWAIDATGRSSFLKRKLGLKKDNDHNVNSVWFRVKGEIDIQEWSKNPEWRQILNPGLRRLGTVHFMGKGYWVWFIPLSSGNTSIGIVADPRFHDFDKINKLDKALEWLKEHEPLCYEHVLNYKDDVLDFKILKKYSYDCKQFYSADRWALVGEAGAFLDPFYSPGTDFISMANSWVTDLVLRDFEGEDIFTRATVYDQVHARLFENWVPIYLEKYELYGNAQVMSVKITWDFAVYWAIPSLLFTNQGLTNMNVLKALFTTQNSFGDRFAKLNKQVQQFYLDWGRLDNPYLEGRYVDPMSLPFVEELQKGIEVIYSTDEELITQLEKNLKTLEMFAAELFRVVAHKLKALPLSTAIDPYEFKLNAIEDIKDTHSALAIDRDEKMAQQTNVLWLEEKVVY